MQIDLIIKFVLLLAIANGAPVVAKRLLGKFLSYPLDTGRTFIDGRALFGSSKTLRGILMSIIATSLCAPLLGFDLSGDTRADSVIDGVVPFQVVHLRQRVLVPDTLRMTLDHL